MQITVKVINGQVRNGLKNIARSVPKVYFRNIWRLMTNAMERRKEYPPPPPNSTYNRTGNFGGSVKLEKHSAGVVGARFSVGVNYAPYVGGYATGEGQAEIHSGRWELTADIVQAEVTDQIAEEVDADLQRVINQQGMGL